MEINDLRRVARASGLGSATVPLEGRRVFGETPKTATAMVALPKPIHRVVKPLALLITPLRFGGFATAPFAADL
jgi:hypothetical protein